MEAVCITYSSTSTPTQTPFSILVALTNGGRAKKNLRRATILAVEEFLSTRPHANVQTIEFGVRRKSSELTLDEETGISGHFLPTEKALHFKTKGAVPLAIFRRRTNTNGNANR